MLKAKNNIVLVGMPGAGKSTVGVILAKALSMGFIDTDVFIQAGQNKGLQEIIDEKGLEKFCEIEEEFVLCCEYEKTVIATGGSVVYSQKAMEHLKKNGVAVYLELPLEEIEKRLTNLAYRGVVMQKSQTMQQLYANRKPLYEKYADITIQCTGLGHEQVVEKIIKGLQ